MLAWSCSAGETTSLDIAGLGTLRVGCDIAVIGVPKEFKGKLFMSSKKIS